MVTWEYAQLLFFINSNVGDAWICQVWPDAPSSIVREWVEEVDFRGVKRSRPQRYVTFPDAMRAMGQSGWEAYAIDRSPLAGTSGAPMVFFKRRGTEED